MNEKMDTLAYGFESSGDSDDLDRGNRVTDTEHAMGADTLRLVLSEDRGTKENTIADKKQALLDREKIKTPENCREINRWSDVGHELEFDTSEDFNKFVHGELLENAMPTAHGRFGDACWEQFWKDNPDWAEEDLEPDTLATFGGGGFGSLPTVEAVYGGEILFCSEKQLDFLLHKSPWICDMTYSTSDTYRNRSDKKGYFLAIDSISDIVVIDDETIKRIEEEDARWQEQLRAKETE